MTKEIKVRPIKLPKQLLSGFLDFSIEVSQKAAEKGVKLTDDEVVDVFNNSFPGRIRTNFFLWVIDLNGVIDGINIILTDLSDLRRDKNSLKGNPIVRSELLFQAFFGEFFRMREISKIFIKLLSNEKVLSKRGKESFVELYFKAFDHIYEIRNMFIHQGLSFKNDEMKIDIAFFDGLSKEEKKKFVSLLKESNTRENTVEIQCAVYVKYINLIMKKFVEFQEKLNSALADLIIQYEKEVLTLTVEKVK